MKTAGLAPPPSALLPRPRWLRGIQLHVALLILLALLPPLGLAIHSDWAHRRIHAAQARENASQIANLTAARIEGSLEKVRELMSVLVRVEAFLDAEPERSFGILNALLGLYPEFSNFGIAESNGRLFCQAVPENPHPSFDKEPWFHDTLVMERFTAGTIVANPATFEPAVRFGYPLMTKSGQLQRLLYADFRLSALAAQLRIDDLPGDTVVSLIGDAGETLARTPDTPASPASRQLDPTLLRLIRTGGQGTTEYSHPGAGRHFYAFTEAMKSASLGFSIVVGMPASRVYREANQILLRNLSLLSASTLLALCMAGFYAERQLVRPVRALLGLTRKISMGDLSARTELQGRPLEVRELSDAFDEMAALLEQRQEELRHAHQEIRKWNAELERRVEERTAALLAANQEIESFSYSVSHDLRAPIRQVLSYAQLVERDHAGSLSARGVELLGSIREAASRMGRLIDDLLAFSRMGRDDLKLQDVSLDSLVAKVRNDLRHETVQRNIEWRIQPLPMVSGDTSLLHLVLANLLSNAIKFTRHRDPATIEVGCATKDGEHIISIRDNGAGFDMRHAHKLFTVFNRLHRQDEFEGTGIGLATVRKIVLRHGGRVWAEARVNTGATFHFSLPAQPRSDLHE